MPICCVVGCSSNSEKKLDKKIMMHMFPQNVELRQRWIRAVNRADWSPTKYTFICSLHFEERCYNRRRNDYPKLYPGSVPTIFPNTSNYDGKPQKPQKVSRKRPLSESDDDDSC